MSGSDAFIWRHLGLQRHCITEAAFLITQQSLLPDGSALLDLQSSHNQPHNARLIVFVYVEWTKCIALSPEALKEWHTIHVGQFNLDVCMILGKNISYHSP